MRGYIKSFRCFELNGRVYQQKIYCNEKGGLVFMKIKPSEREVKA